MLIEQLQQLFKSGFKHRLYLCELNTADIELLQNTELFQAVCLRLKLAEDVTNIVELILKFHIQQTQNLTRAGIRYGIANPEHILKSSVDLTSIVKWSRGQDLQYINIILQRDDITHEDFLRAISYTLRRKSCTLLHRLLCYRQLQETDLEKLSLKRCHWNPIAYLLNLYPNFFTTAIWIHLALNTFDGMLLRGAIIRLRKIGQTSSEFLHHLAEIHPKYLTYYGKFADERIYTLISMAELRLDIELLYKLLPYVLRSGRVYLLEYLDRIATRLRHPIVYDESIICQCNTTDMKEYVLGKLPGNTAQTTTSQDIVETVSWAWYLNKLKILIKIF